MAEYAMQTKRKEHTEKAKSRKIHICKKKIRTNCPAKGAKILTYKERARQANRQIEKQTINMTIIKTKYSKDTDRKIERKSAI